VAENRMIACAWCCSIGGSKRQCEECGRLFCHTCITLDGYCPSCKYRERVREEWEQISLEDDDRD